MRNFLNSIRTPDTNMSIGNKIINTILIFLIGIVLGIFSKWLDNLSIDDTIWWQYIIGILDLCNIFSMFGIWLLIATTISVFSKTPLLAFICWYARGNGKISLIICSGILAVMLISSFSIGMWYFDFKSVIDTVLFIGIIVVLYTSPKKSVYSLLGSLILAFDFSVLV